MRKLKSKEEIKAARLRDRLVIESAQDAGCGAHKLFAISRACSLVCEAHKVPLALALRTASRLATALGDAVRGEGERLAAERARSVTRALVEPIRAAGWAAYLPRYSSGELKEAAAILAEQCAQAFYLIDLLASDPGPAEDHAAWFLETCVNPSTMEPYDNWAYRAWLRAQKLTQDTMGRTDHPDPLP